MATALLGTAALAACSQNTLGADDDCSADVQFEDAAYRSVSLLQAPKRGARIGEGTWLDCEGSPVTEWGSAKVFRVRGQDPKDVILVREEGGDAVYIDKTVAWRDRPQLLKDANNYLTCTGPARFTGSWDYVDPTDMPSMEDYDSARVPYTGNFSVSEGSGVGLERWAEVTLQAEITSDTQPVPDAEFLERATAQDEQVEVTATCSGEGFQVRTIRFAD